MFFFLRVFVPWWQPIFSCKEMVMIAGRMPPSHGGTKVLSKKIIYGNKISRHQNEKNRSPCDNSGFKRSHLFSCSSIRSENSKFTHGQWPFTGNYLLHSGFLHDTLVHPLTQTERCIAVFSFCFINRRAYLLGHKASFIILFGMYKQRLRIIFPQVRFTKREEKRRICISIARGWIAYYILISKSAHFPISIFTCHQS